MTNRSIHSSDTERKHRSVSKGSPSERASSGGSAGNSAARPSRSPVRGTYSSGHTTRNYTPAAGKSSGRTADSSAGAGRRTADNMSAGRAGAKTSANADRRTAASNKSGYTGAHQRINSGPADGTRSDHYAGQVKRASQNPTVLKTAGRNRTASADAGKKTAASTGSRDIPRGRTGAAAAGSGRNIPPGKGRPSGGRNIPPGRTAAGGGRNIPSGRTAAGGGRNIPPGRTAPGGGRSIPPGKAAPGGGRNIPPGKSRPSGGRDIPRGRKPVRRRRKSRRWPLVLALIAIILVFLFVINRWEITFVKKGDNPMTMEVGTEYTDPGVRAEVTGSLLPLIRIKIPCTTSTADLDTDRLGSYTVTYTADFAWMHGTGTRVVIVQDTTPPVITLQHKDDYYTLPNHAYEEEGYTATDNYDGDITDKVTSEEKDGKVFYTVTDSSGNTDSAEREIVYDDRTSPEITFPSGSDIYISEGDTWTDDVTAEDDADGDVTGKIEISGEPDTSKPGTYTVTYKVTDSWGNEATASRTITVEKKALNDVAQIDETKIIYLTFDDGPGQYTEKLLGILDKYNVKATFFVTAAYSQYQDLIGREYQAGHSIGVHSASHDYAKIYKSTDAYWDDFEKMEDIIEKQTGSRTRLFRFPGGSSNTVSASYSKGIMTELTKEAGEKGLTYVDWNVTSGDAGDTTDGNVMYNNMIKGIHTYEHSFILCHDVKQFTVNMIEKFIKEALKEGYTFLPITSDSPTCHHKINN